MAERWIVAAVGEPLQVDVVGDLDDELIEVLDQRHPGVGVAGDSQGREHELAELVGRRDRGAIEIGESIGDAATTEGDFSVVAGREVSEQSTLLPSGRGVGQSPLGLDELGPHALTQLLAGSPTERDDQHLRERGDTLCDVPGDQGPDRERLARAGAGLEHGGADGKGSEKVERLHDRCPPSRTGFQSVTASAPRRVLSPSTSSPGPGCAANRRSRGAAGPQTRT